MEDHLAECVDCRARMTRLMDADKIAGNLPKQSAPSDSWTVIEKEIGGTSVLTRATVSRKSPVLIISIVALLAMIGIGWRVWSAKSNANPAEFDPKTFQAVPLNNISSNVQPHISTEGYVSEIRLDHEEGELMFKLVDDLQRPNHFVMCEVIGDVKLKVPPIGSRVRVYGVTRYDGQSDRQWYELHPVLNIVPIQ
jgi:hypothetical protein